MKKKIALIASVVVILAMLAVGGTLAWFTDNDSATNVFTIGSVAIEQIEQQYAVDNEGNKTLVSFENDKVLMPIVNTANPAADENYLDKIVTVKTTGKNPAYVSTHIAVPAVLDSILVLDVNVGGEGDLWAPATTPTEEITLTNGMDYKVYSYVYTQALDTDDTTELTAVTQVLLNGVYLKAEVDCQETKDAQDNSVMRFCTKNANGGWDFYDYDVTGTVEILVATQGCQSQGFADAFNAIDTAFGAIPDFGQVNP